MKKYSSTAAVILVTSSSSTDATRQAEGAVAAAIGRDHDIIHSSSKLPIPTTVVAPVYAGYYCMGCDDYWRRRNNNGNDDDNSSLRKNKELVSAAIKKLGRAVVHNRSSQRKRFKENSANVALIESNTVDTAANPLPIRFDVDEILLAAEERSPTLDKDHPPTRQEDNDIYLVASALQPQTVESTCTTTDLAASNTIGADDNNIVISLLKENQLLKERLELLREIELREKIDLLQIGLSNALNEHGLSSLSSSSSGTEEESHHILMEQVLINILKSNEQREKQLFCQMSITVILVGSLLVAVIYIHNYRNDKKEKQVTTEGLTDLIIPSMCPTSPTESLGSITEEGVGVLGNQLGLQEENKMLRNQIDLMRAIGPTNGVIHEDQEYDGSVLSDASISVDYSNRMRWWRFGIRPQLLQQQQRQQQRSIVKGLDRVKADEAAKDVSLLNQHDTAAVDINDGDSVSQPPQPRWGWGRRKIENDVVSPKRSRGNDDGKSNDDDRSQVSLSSMGIAASIDYQLKKMSESC